MTNYKYTDDDFFTFLSETEPVTASELARLLSDSYGMPVSKSVTSRRLHLLQNEGKVKKTDKGWLLGQPDVTQMLPTEMFYDSNPSENPNEALFFLMQWYRNKFGGELAQLFFSLSMEFTENRNRIEYLHSEYRDDETGMTYEEEIDAYLASLKQLIMEFEGMEDDE